MSPLVSVIIPTHNRPDFLRDAIASVKAQTFTDYEIIVVSNGERSDKRQTSRALAVANGCLYLELSKGNVSLARNAGIERSRGEWIAFLDDDDLWLPHKLDRQIADARLTGADMIACDYVEFFPDGTEVIRRPRCVEGWPYVKAINNTYWYALPSATIVRKSVFGHIGGFDSRFLGGAEDGDMWRRLSWDRAIHQMDEILIRYRRGHPSFMQHERRRIVDDLFHYMKMRSDTPQHLRWTLPSAIIFVGQRIVAILVPIGLQRWLRPRTRWIRFRHWLQPRTARLYAHILRR